MALEQTKRISFDREQRVVAPSTAILLIYDEEELPSGWERVYTTVSVFDDTNAPRKFRFGTGDKQKIKWHEEEADPAAEVVYCTCNEYHARQHNLGCVGVYDPTINDKIIVVWHGYDKRIGER